MRDRLLIANADLLRRVQAIQRLIDAALVSGTMAGYCQQVREFCAEQEKRARLHLAELRGSNAGLLGDLFNATSVLAQKVRYADRTLAVPLVRFRRQDVLALRVLQWLHQSTKETAHLTFALGEDDYKVWASPMMPCIYYILLTHRQSLLSLPLVFHEFGHVLYECHKPEMDELVKEFRETVSHFLTPQAVGDASLAAQGLEFRQQAVTCWYTWAQEFFCDAVGLTIGGSAFLRSLSRHFHSLSREEYAIDRATLLRRKHPLTWLRIQLLCRRATAMGYERVSTMVAEEWHSTASDLGIEEEHHGTWDETLRPDFDKMIDDMLVQSDPPSCTDLDAKAGSRTPITSILALFHAAWAAYGDAPDTYEVWERLAIRRFVS
ncbi:MAG: hypothetical protein K8U57_08695 [Planctomycetes bacterium]|nr:hypothetical protein [Planctomycetota bacterium]